MSHTPLPISAYHKVVSILSQAKFRRSLGYVVFLGAIGAGFATYNAFRRATFYAADNKQIFILLAIDIFFLLTFAVVIAKSMGRLWVERKQNLAGSKLHTRLSLIFAFLAVTPTVVVAIFSMLFFNFGVQTWFDNRVKVALSESMSVAEAYLEEHQRAIGIDARGLSEELTLRMKYRLRNDRILEEDLRRLADRRDMSEAVIFDAEHRVVARYGFTYSLEFEEIPLWVKELADRNQVAVVANKKGDRVRAMVRLSTEGDRLLYLFTGRAVSAKVLTHVKNTEQAVKNYRVLELDRSQFEIMFIVIFGVLALLMLLIAVWVGLSFATQLTLPISQLIGAAERVRAGDLTVRVPDPVDEMDLAPLSRSFNKMTRQLEEQQTKLLRINKQLERRRLFMEAVLSGVSAGVISLDADGAVKLFNQASETLLGNDLKKGKPFIDLIPEGAILVKRAQESPETVIQDDVTLHQVDGTKILMMRLLAQETGGCVVTFDDITDLVAAQRKAAWSDVARRIAHEIKNPLTPIQLSAERLRRKFLSAIDKDADVFNTCVDTIVRQVGVIGHMVDEFSEFARMPEAQIAPEDFRDLVEKALFLQRQAHPKITYDLDFPAPCIHPCDGLQMTQILTNLLKNAAESLNEQGNIWVRFEETDRTRTLVIEDNGPGFPTENRERLMEPYVTMREKGTGLGLAIVKKIMVDHDGTLLLEDRPGGGARVKLVFKKPKIQSTRDKKTHAK